VASSKPSSIGDSRITIVRIDPHLWELAFIGLSQTGESTGHTARGWCQSQGLTAAINAGMFASDYKTHLGYLQFRGHVNSSHVNGYQSVAAFDPKNPSGLVRSGSSTWMSLVSPCRQSSTTTRRPHKT